MSCLSTPKLLHVISQYMNNYESQVRLSAGHDQTIFTQDTLDHRRRPMVAHVRKHLDQTLCTVSARSFCDCSIDHYSTNVTALHMLVAEVVLSNSMSANS